MTPATDPSSLPEPRGASPPRRGWVLYDDGCGLCSSWAGRHRAALEQRGFGVAGFTEPWVRQRLRLPHGRTPDRMALLDARGRRHDGVDALARIARHTWWAWPLWLLTRVPGLHGLAGWVYDAVARRRHALSRLCRLPAPSSPDRPRPPREAP